MKTVSAPIILLAIILVAIIATATTATATFDSGLLAANYNLLKKNALQQSNHLRRRRLEEQVEEDGVDVQEDNSEVRTIA
jgi:hypothetical protein